MVVAATSGSEDTENNCSPTSPADLSVESSPPAGSPPAKRPRTRAAARGGDRLDPPTPEKSRVAGETSPCMLDLSVSAELCADRDEPPVSPPPLFSPPPPAYPFPDVLVAEGGCIDSTVEEAPPLMAENCTSVYEDAMGPGEKNLEKEKSAAVEVREFLWAWAENGYLEKELEEGVRSRGGWRKVYDVIFPVLPPVPMRCRFCKEFDINMGFDDDLLQGNG